ncbi:hypothetical protein J6590_028130 [Homalodisca vitripennis]|nr:hypothetical protein J6590_028130 [Homalodisca vitripennis]
MKLTNSRNNRLLGTRRRFYFKISLRKLIRYALAFKKSSLQCQKAEPQQTSCTSDDGNEPRTTEAGAVTSLRLWTRLKYLLLPGHR